MTTGATSREVGAVLDELIDRTRETKPIEWIVTRGPQREVLERLDAFLVGQVDAITSIEARVGGRLPAIVMPSARPRQPLAASSATDAVRDRLLPHLRAVSVDVRDHAQRLDGPATEYLNRLADGLEGYGDELAATGDDGTNDATERG
jgi:hypothetical protein